MNDQRIKANEFLLELWQPGSKLWGHVWAEAKTAPSRAVAGLGGSMAGLTVATFYGPAGEQAARAFAADFEAGRVFCCENAAQWLAMVESANRARSFDADTMAFLRARGRSEGLAIDGRLLTAGDLHEHYASGGRFDGNL